MYVVTEQVDPQTQNFVSILLDDELQLTNRLLREPAMIMRK